MRKHIGVQYLCQLYSLPAGRHPLAIEWPGIATECIEDSIKASTMPAQVAAEPTQKNGLMRAVQTFSAYFEERGLGAQDIPAAIIIHEAS